MLENTKILVATTIQMTRSEKSSPMILLLSSKWFETGNSVERAVSPGLSQVLARLEKLRRLLNRSFALDLPIVSRPWDLKMVKRFCGEILEPCVVHQWKLHLLSRHVCLRTRVSVASTLFLFRKVIPEESLSDAEKLEACNLYIKKMTSPQDIPNSDFLRFVSAETKRLFPRGWDRRWDSVLDTFVPPTTSCRERSRKKGGVRGKKPGPRHSLRVHYEEFVSGVNTWIDSETSVIPVDTGGKVRLVSKYSDRRCFFSPLHNLLYDHLSKNEWLLRGEATPDSFHGFERKEGEIFVSGDYESATDNLNIHLSRFVFSVCLDRATHVPENVKGAALSALTSTFSGVPQRRGQLMGSLLSFPLLCLINYLTFRYAIRRRGVPVRINGDDIVFRCRPSELVRWESEVGSSGLVLSKGKTLVARSTFSLNSSFFRARDTAVEALPTIRSTCLFGAADSPESVGGRLSRVVGCGGVLGDLTRALALNEMSKQVWSSQRSVRRGLMGVCSNRSLRWSGMLERESFYNSLPSEPSVPVPLTTFYQNALPPGFSRVRVADESAKDDPMFAFLTRERCWTMPGRVRNREGDSEYWDKVRDGTLRFVPYPDMRFGLQSGCSASEYHQLRNRFVSARVPPGVLVWRATEMRPGGVVRFVKAAG